MPAGNNQLGADNNPRAPDLPTVHKAHDRVFNPSRLVLCDGHLETRLPRQEPPIPGWIMNFAAADDALEDGVDGADKREADPLGRLPSKRRHDHPDESHVAGAAHQEQTSALGARQTPGIREDNSVVLPGEVADDAAAEGADEEIRAEGAERGATRHHRGALPEGRAALPGCTPHIIAVSHHACLEDGEPAEESSISGELLILFTSVKTPLVSILEHCLESLLELQTVHQHEELGGNLTVMR